MIIHIVPKDDIKEHILESYCECSAILEEQPNGNFLCIHNSWDCREIREELGEPTGKKWVIYIIEEIGDDVANK